MQNDLLRQNEMTANDLKLLREFAETNSETAFAEIVSRHVSLVYSVALRQVGDAYLAEEITQAVFVILARKAKSLGEKTILSGWLCRTARFACADALKMQRRRQRREQEAYMQSQIESGTGILPVSETWNQISPLLDAALAKLVKKDHDAVVLRFFENKNFNEVGAAIGANENAAKMRVSRALEKLRKIFSKNGVMLSSAIIASAVSENSVHAAPIGLAKTISAIALTKGATASVSTLTIIRGALKIMAWSKVKTAVVVGVIALITAGTATVTVKKIEQHKADESWRVRPFDSRVLDQASPQVKILPAKLPNGGGFGHGRNGKMMGIAVSSEAVVETAYDFWSFARIIVTTELPKGGYDFIASLPSGNAEALQQEIKKQFGVVARREAIETNVLLLTVKYPNAQGLKSNTTHSQASQLGTRPGHFFCVNSSIDDLSMNLENMLEIPVINQTGISGKFDIDFNWNQNDPQHDSLKQALLDQLGLELVPTNMPIEMLVVEKAK